MVDVRVAAVPPVIGKRVPLRKAYVVSGKHRRDVQGVRVKAVFEPLEDAYEYGTGREIDVEFPIHVRVPDDAVEEKVALHLSDGEIFAAPAYPLETIFDPTGAGDSFAGGFMGYLASRDGAGLTEMDYRLATMYGSAIASFTVEAFSTGRLQGLSREEIESRLAAFRALTEFRV